MLCIPPSSLAASGKATVSQHSLTSFRHTWWPLSGRGSTRLVDARLGRTTQDKDFMRTAIITIEGMSPYSQSKYHEEPKIGQESSDAHERRTWRHRMHVNKDGYVFIPPMAAKNGLVSAAKFLNMKIRGEGNKTYTKRFESGVLCLDPLVLPVKRDEVASEELFVPSDGIRGSGKRVVKVFGVIPSWGGDFTVGVMDEKITEEVFAQHVDAWGTYIGIGRFRPEKNGFYGRFVAKEIRWL